MNGANLHSHQSVIDSAQVDHFGIVVADVTTATSFYRDILGCQVSEPIERPGQGLKKAYVTFGNMFVELISPTTTDSPIKHILAQHNVSDFLARNPAGGLHHVCYSVTNLAVTCDKLIARGYRLLGASGAVVGGAGSPVCFLDPQKVEGVLVELKQR